jgi:hypothetical protein
MALVAAEKCAGVGCGRKMCWRWLRPKNVLALVAALARVTLKIISLKRASSSQLNTQTFLSRQGTWSYSLHWG